MSYILDALKKSQSEQSSDGVALRVQQTTKRARTSWLAITLGLILLCNAGLLLWIFVLDEDTVATDPKITSEPAPNSDPVEVVSALPAPQPQSSELRESRAEVQTRVREEPRTVIAKFGLEDLPSIEQSIYNGFTYTTHIYTDDPTLCAIVVDGQRLMAGDSFKGLGVVAITEAGVIFEENRRGHRRQVEVSVLDQWEK
jgi:hypothetical protein